MPNVLPTHAYETFAIRQPITPDLRPISCKQYGCKGYLEGFSLSLTQLRQEGLEVAARSSGRRYREVQLTPEEIYLVFEPGQQCFAWRSHLPERPAFFFVGLGDYRSFNIKHARQHVSADDWAENMAEDLNKIRTVLERG